MIKRYSSYSWDDLDEDLKQSIQGVNQQQADAWRMQWEVLNSTRSQTAFANQSSAVFYQPEKVVTRRSNSAAPAHYVSDTWDQFDEDLKQSLRKRANTQVAFRHCLWDMMASDDSKECCFFDCCCEGSGYRIAEKKAA